MEFQRIFDNFKLDNLDKQWVQSVWDEQFTSYRELPDNYVLFLENVNMELLLNESCAIIRKWLTRTKNNTDTNDEELEISWHTLIIFNVNLQGLLAILGYLIKTGQNNGANNKARQYCFKATSLYFMLLAIPGSNAFNVFHPNLYKSAVTCLKLSDKLIPVTKKHYKTLDAQEQQVGEEQTNNCIALNNAERTLLTKGLNGVICDLILMISSFSFKEHIYSLDVTIELTLDVTRLQADVQYLQLQFKDMQSSIVMTLPNNAYIALLNLCDIKHGPIDVTITLISKYLLPRLSVNHTDVQFKAMKNAREASIYFLSNILHTYEEESRNAITTLIQQLMLRCPERAEARQKQAAIIMKVLNICTENIFLDAVENVMLLSHNTKISYRIFAQEVIGHFLTESFPGSFPCTDAFKNKLKRVLVAFVFSRCTDCSSMVRGKAMATISELVEASGNDHDIMCKDIFQASNSSDKPFCTFEELRNALVTDINPLPGLNTVISMLMDRVEDERALVRRSALQILKNIIIVSPTLIGKVYPAISRRCRDPMVIVRRFAIDILTQILDQNSYNNELVDEWVTSVVPQIFDIDNKVQDKVLECLNDLVLSKIKNVTTYSCDVNNTLPWRILHTLTCFRMRKHLTKACNLWIKNGVITEQMVKNIQSHIGTDNNISAWVFLAALGESMKLPNISKYIVNCRELVKGNNVCTSLVLQVIRNSWMSLSKDALRDLRFHLYDCLCKFEISFGLISICLDIVHMVTQYLNPNNGTDLLKTDMVKLMKLSESKVGLILQNSNMAIEALPCYLKAMTTLGHTAFYCTSQISASTLRILQGLILEWDTLPTPIKKIEALQPMAVALLGQQALRDRKIAKEVIPLFGQLMRQETNLSLKSKTSVKINAAKALADLCIRFTALVEPYLSDMCISMKDADSTVREAIVVIFIQLLLEDFIKIKGPFFFHLLTMLSDPDPTIRDLTTFLVEERLLVKNKTLIFQQFIESIYHYNNYRHKFKLRERKMRDKEKKALTFPGKKNQMKRRVIYDFMLDHLDPPGKIKLLVKLTAQVLSGACDDLLDIRTEEGQCILKDTLYIISSERLQISSATKCADGNIDEEESASQPSTQLKSAISVITEGMKKHSLDVLLPLLIKLRIKLASSKSLVEKDVQKSLVKIYSDYTKEQLANLLSEYPKLEEEVEHYRKSLAVEMRTNNDDTHEEESVPSTVEPQGTLNENRCPPITSDKILRVVIRRLSPRTCSKISNYKGLTSLPNSNNTQYPLLGSNNQRSCVSTRSRFQEMSPPEPGPSTSTPFLISNNDCPDSRTSGTNAKRTKRRVMRSSPTSSKGSTVRKRLLRIETDSESD